MPSDGHQVYWNLQWCIITFRTRRQQISFNKMCSKLNLPLVVCLSLDISPVNLTEHSSIHTLWLFTICVSLEIISFSKNKILQLISCLHVAWAWNNIPIIVYHCTLDLKCLVTFSTLQCIMLLFGKHEFLTKLFPYIMKQCCVVFIHFLSFYCRSMFSNVSKLSVNIYYQGFNFVHEWRAQIS